MTTSTITVSGLTVTPGFGQNFLHWSLTDPNTLTYRKLDAVEIHSATSNDRAGASKVSEAKASDGIHTVADGVARWYWIRARDLSGDFGDWYPVSPTGGVAASSTAVLSAAGYATLPNGLIFEWGNVTTDGSGLGTATCQKITQALYHWNAVSNPAVMPTTDAYSVIVDTFTTGGGFFSAGFKVMKASNGGAVGAAASLPVKWFAIGR